MPDLISRPKFESRLADELNTLFAKYLTEIQILLSDFNTTLGDINTLPEALYARLQDEIILVLEAFLIDAYIEAFTTMDGFLSDNSSRSSRRGALFVQNDAQDWARIYAPKLAKDLVNTTRQELRRIAERSPALPISGQGLRDMIKPAMDLQRAQLIARTELTNVISEAENSAIDKFREQERVTVEAIWYTKLDERVCNICEPRHGKPQGINWELPPPAHPRCRCEVEYRVTYPDGTVKQFTALEARQLELF
jgi:hypothetical protein